VKKCGYESSSVTEKPEVLLEQIAETDVEDTTERCGSPVIKVRCRSSSNEEEKCCCEKESMSVDTVTTQGGKTKVTSAIEIVKIVYIILPCFMAWEMAFLLFFWSQSVI
jgi:hypothetical protein